MKHVFVLSAVAVAALAGSAMADISTINGLQFKGYENFANGAPILPGTASMNGGPIIPQAYNQITPMTIAGDHSLNETYPALSPGFANRHTLFFSNDGGSTAYQLQAGESFRITACFETNTNIPTGIGAPANDETGIWINNPRVALDGTHFTDEGGVWLITNGTSFSGGAGQEFFLFGEGGFNNPAHPPIYGNNEEVDMSYTYYAPGYFGPGSHAAFEATVDNITRGLSVSSGLRAFFPILDADGNPTEDGLNPGTLFGFRYQNQVFPPFDDNTTTNIACVTITPTPGAAALLGLGGLIVGRRRR